MKVYRCKFIFTLITILLFAENSDCQFEQFFADYGMDCSKHGVDIGLFPNLTDFWFINVPCKNYNGSVGCITTDDELPGICGCNLREGAYFDQEMQVCLGKVGAVCTAEKTNLVPAKLCTPNADCFPNQSEGHTVGTCKCLYGFKEEDGRCIIDENIGDADRSTPRTPTTTQAPNRGSIKLPLDLLLGSTVVGLNKRCQGTSLLPLLNRTVCDTHQGTVSCIDRQCQCNMGGDDSIFDKELGQCVGLAGSYCLTRQNLIGYKGCIYGADCFLDAGYSDAYSFGVCQCLYGYNEKNDGTCERDYSIPNPSTRRPGGLTASTPTTTSKPSTSTTEGAARCKTITLTLFATILSGHLMITLVSLLYRL